MVLPRIRDAARDTTPRYMPDSIPEDNYYRGRSIRSVDRPNQYSSAREEHEAALYNYEHYHRGKKEALFGRPERREEREVIREGRKAELDRLSKEHRELTLAYKQETDPYQKKILKQRLELNKRSISNLSLAERKGVTDRFGFRGVPRLFGGDGREGRMSLRRRIAKLDSAFSTLPSDPFEKVQVNNLGIHGFGSKLFKFRMGPLNINKGFEGDFDRVFFNKKQRSRPKSKGFRRYRYYRRKKNRKH